MSVELVWQLIKDAGPLALAGAFFYAWIRERERFDKERNLNEVRTDKLYELGVSTRDTLAKANILIEAALRHITEGR